MRTAPPKLLQALGVLLFAVLSVLSGITLSNHQNAKQAEQAHCLLACEVAAVECCDGSPFCGGEGMDLVESEACYKVKDACEDECS